MGFNLVIHVMARAVKFLKRWKLWIFIVTCVLFTNYSTNSTKSLMATISPFTLRKHADSNLFFDDFCEMSGEWELLNRNVYIKRSSAFYFIDADLLRFYLVTNSAANYTNSSFILTLTFLDSAQNRALKHIVDSRNVYLASHWKFAEYHAMHIDARLAISQTKVDFDKFEVLLTVKDSVTNFETKKYLKVIVKYLEQTRYMIIYICIQCKLTFDARH